MFQLEAMRACASREGVGLREYPAEIDVSGSRKSRVVLDRIIADIETGELAGIMVAKLDRLSRLAPKDRLELVERIDAVGGMIVSASENIDRSTPEGRFTFEVWLGIARMQWEQYAAGFLRAKVNATADGRAIKSKAPYGYRLDEANRLVVVEREAALVRELFELRRLGGSYGDVLEHFERVSGRSSTRNTMRKMLANRAYLGELHYGKVDPLVNLAAHEAIVEVELFEAAGAVSDERSRTRGFYSGGAPKSLLAGIARCAGCGTGLVRSQSGGKGRALTYRCPKDTRHCPARASIGADVLDAYVIEQVLAWAGEVADVEVEAAHVSNSIRRDAAELRLVEAELRLREWSADLDAEESDPEAYRSGLEARRQRVELRRQELDALGEATELEAVRSTLRRALTTDELDVDSRRGLLAIVLRAVVVCKLPYRGAPVRERARLAFADEPAPLVEPVLELTPALVAAESVHELV
jgi:site-specific DNA recombinase